MLPHAVLLLFAAVHMPTFVTSRFCEGGHICSLPRECCTQGCCPPYQSGPRQLPPPSEHVLNLFFISHWFFWCVVVAIILAILCAYSLWKKRRTLCGWGFPDHHAQSEGDSAGSCYAPPQYSRCSSFHHPPPPYTEVTSKPDLYPLVFTCNSDNGKNGSSYLMVQYFRNYIVRPAGSLSAASTIDSLSSSFICNANEANTLVPPPYSRAASPEIGFSSHFQQQYMMPRSASQLVCTSAASNDITASGGVSGNLASQQVYQRTPHYTVVALNGAAANASVLTSPYNTQLRSVDSDQFQTPDADVHSASASVSVGVGGGAGASASAVEQPAQQRTTTGFAQSQSDQHFRYIANSNSSISDIFVNQSCGGMVSGVGTSADRGSCSGALGGTHESCAHALSSTSASETALTAIGAVSTFANHPQAGGTPVIFSNGRIKPNPLHRTSTNPTQFVDSAHRIEPVYNSLNSIEGLAIAVPAVRAESADAEFRDLHKLRRSLETCCQLLQHQHQHQQQQKHHQQQNMTTGGLLSSGDSPLRMHDLTKKFAEEGLRSYMTSGTCSGVSSLANIGTPSSPPQATSPTGEVKEILDQIRQLQEGVSYEDLLVRPSLQHTQSSPSPSSLSYAKTQGSESTASAQLQRFPTMPEQQSFSSSRAPTATTLATSRSKHSLTSPSSSPNPRLFGQRYSTGSSKSIGSSGSSKRPSTLQQTKKKFYSPKPNKALYIPMTANGPAPLQGTAVGRCMLKSPVSSVVGANFFGSRSRVRKAWISRSAPTTPGTNLPPNHMGDDSPLLNEHDEDPEGEQIAEME